MSALRSRISGFSIAVGVFATALGAAPARAAGDAEFTASVDREQIGLDDTVTLELTMTVSNKGDNADLRLPPFRDFDVVGRSSNEQVSFAFTNGAPSFRRTTQTRLTLSPHHAGQLIIEPVHASLHGQMLSTQQLSVQVLPAGQSPPPRPRQQQQPPQRPPNPFAGLDPFADDPGADPFAGMHAGNAKDFTLKSVVDNEHPFVGQQVTWSLLLLARSNVSSIDKLGLPKTDGFWTEEIEAPQQLSGEQRVVDGVPMTVFLIRRRALFPLRAGRTQIDAAEVEVISGMGMLFSRSSVKRSSAAITLDVQALPPDAPAGFDPGNVGQWQLSAALDPPSVTVGQPSTLRLVASGRGNLRDLQLPKLPAIPGLRAYDATSNDKTSLEQGHAGGQRTIEQLLVPERTGSLEIPALTMEVFDPTTREYRTLRTQPQHLTVTAGSATQGASQQPAQNLLQAGGMRPIRLKLERASPGIPPWRRLWFWPALLLPPIFFLFLLAADRMRRTLSSDPADRRVKQAASAAKARLRGAEKLLAQQKTDGSAGIEFYAEVSRALSGYLADKQKISTAGLTREELGRALVEKGHSRVTADKLIALLDACDQARFSPGAESAAAQEAVLQRADTVLSALDGSQKEGAS